MTRQPLGLDKEMHSLIKFSNCHTSESWLVFSATGCHPNRVSNVLKGISNRHPYSQMKIFSNYASAQNTCIVGAGFGVKKEIPA
jgi:hypothetical protein